MMTRSGGFCRQDSRLIAAPNTKFSSFLTVPTKFHRDRLPACLCIECSQLHPDPEINFNIERSDYYLPTWNSVLIFLGLRQRP